MLGGSGERKSRIQHILDQIQASGRMTRQEHLSLTFTLLAEHRISDAERSQINQILDRIQSGHLKLMD